MGKQEVWNSAFNSSVSKGYSGKDSLRIANISASQYREPVKGKRSMAVNRNFVETGNILDILVGYPDSGLEVGLRDNLDSSGWESFTSRKTKADIEHFNLDMSQGVANDLDDKWHHFSVESEMYKQGNEIRARIVIPDTDLGNEFKEDYKAGKYGASIEYEGKEGDNNTVNSWEITNFSFTKDPHYDKTKPEGQ